MQPLKGEREHAMWQPPESWFHSPTPQLVVVGTARGTVLTVFTAGTTSGTLFPSFGFLFKHAVREAELAGLVVNLKEFHLNGVAFLDAGFFHGFETLPSNLADVEQTFLARHELNEAAVGHDADHFCVINLAHFGDGNNGANLGNSSVDAFLVGTAHLNLAYAVFFINRDGGAGFFLHALNDFTAGANDRTNEFLGNLEGFDAGHMGFEFGTGCGHGFHNLQGFRRRDRRT